MTLHLPRCPCFQSKIKKLEQNSVSEAKGKAKEGNKKGQQSRFSIDVTLHLTSTRMQAKLKIVKLLLSIAIFIKKEVTFSLCTILQHSLYVFNETAPVSNSLLDLHIKLRIALQTFHGA